MSQSHHGKVMILKEWDWPRLSLTPKFCLQFSLLWNGAQMKTHSVQGGLNYKWGFSITEKAEEWVCSLTMTIIHNWGREMPFNEHPLYVTYNKTIHTYQDSYSLPHTTWPSWTENHSAMGDSYHINWSVHWIKVYQGYLITVDSSAIYSQISSIVLLLRIMVTFEIC